MDTTEKIAALRELMKEHHMQAYIIPSDDFHGSEYVGDYFKTRSYMSGFTGSAGTLVVTEDEAALWTDGRYFLQANQQLAGSPVVLMKDGEKGVPRIAEFLRDHLKEHAVIGFDGRTVTGAFVKMLRKETDKKQMTFSGEADLAGEIWQERPPMSKKPVWELDEADTGLSRAKKLAGVREKMEKKGADALFLSALDEIAYLLNLRGNDVAYTPVFLAYMLIKKDSAVLCVHEEIISGEIRRGLSEDGVELAPYEAAAALLKALPEGKTVWLDGAFVNCRLMQSVPENVRLLDETSPVVFMKDVKTPQEIKHMRTAHIKDGVAVTRFLYWLKHHVGEEPVTELGAGAKLREFRAQMDGFIDLSFESIIAYGAHGAIVHYSPTPETDAALEPKGFCLADTGGHYREGTTDITRTIVLGPLTGEEKRAYTLVLRGHLELASATFLHGVCGADLDVLAREPLWENGLDYNHGTGHGVGFLLSVHEGPQRIHWKFTPDKPVVPLEAGMIISNEPGLYATGKFGVRHENLMLCCEGAKTEYGQFLHFEDLTMVPYDREAIDAALLNERELAQLNSYHQKVYETISPYLPEEERSWLRTVTAPICK